jgi:putative CRISPR-associated protein (TIGR02619 family)
MPTLILSTCGTSLLTNQAGERRHLVPRHANVRSPNEVPTQDRQELVAIIAQMRQALQTADSSQCAKMSAELNGLLCYYGGRLNAARDLHWLIATDTWLGKATAEAIAEALTAAGQNVEIKHITDLRTNNLPEFRAAMAELIRLCAQELRGMRAGGYRVVFNLTGGFKSVQGFMQSLGMLYADESVYVFESTSELLRLPRLPITLDTQKLAREHQVVLRRLAARLPVKAEDARSVPDTLLMELDGEVGLSVWGEVVWAEAGDALLGEQLWPPVDAKLRFGSKFDASVKNCSADELRQVNERLSDLARHLNDSNYNPNRLNFKPLKGKYPPWTHECNAWANASAKRLFGHFEGGVFVVDVLAEGLH